MLYQWKIRLLALWVGISLGACVQQDAGMRSTHLPDAVGHIIKSACLPKPHARSGKITAEDFRLLNQWFMTLQPIGFVRPSIVSWHPFGWSTYRSYGAIDGVQIGRWRAPVGRFEHSDNDTGETFVVLQGSAEFEMDEQKTALEAGSVIHVPPQRASSVQVSNPIDKMVLICQPQASSVL